MISCHLNVASIHHVRFEDRKGEKSRQVSLHSTSFGLFCDGHCGKTNERRAAERRGDCYSEWRANKMVISQLYTDSRNGGDHIIVDRGLDPVSLRVVDDRSLRFSLIFLAVNRRRTFLVPRL
jgi:hypothetical protein